MISEAFQPSTFSLELLLGSPKGCPKGSVLLKVHEEIGAHIGANVSRILDDSRFELFRQEPGSPLIRSNILYLLLGAPSSRMKSFYSLHGYGYVFEGPNSLKEEAIKDAATLFRSATLSQVVNELNSLGKSSVSANRMRKILKKYMREHWPSFTVRELFGLLYLNKDHDSKIKKDLRELANSLLVPEFFGEGLSFFDAIETLSDCLHMTKKLEVPVGLLGII